MHADPHADGSRLPRPAELSRASARRAARGVSLIELTIVLAVSTTLAVLGARELANQSMTLVAEATGTYFTTLRGALQKQLNDNYVAYADGVAIAGFADPLRPTIAELRTAGVLLPTFPERTPFNQPVAIVGTRTNCPGASCRLGFTAYQTASLVDSQGQPRYGLAAEVLSSTKDGVVSSFATPGQLTGPTASVTNPLGNVGATIGVVANLDSTGFNEFVRRNDTRLTNLNEALTVNAGPLATGGVALKVNGNQENSGNLSVTGSATITGNATVSGLVSGTAGVQSPNHVAVNVAGCLRAALESGGGIVSRATNCVERFRINPADGSAVAKDASGVTRVALVGNSGVIVANAAGGVETVRADGASGRVTSRVANYSLSAGAGASCAGYAEGDTLRDASAYGTIVTCRSGLWRAPGFTTVGLGTGCGTAGVMAQDTSSRALICRNGAWRLLNDRVTSVVSMAMYSGNGAAYVPRPACGTGGAPDIKVFARETGADYAQSPPRNRFTMLVSVSGANWLVNPVLKDANNASYASSFTGAAYSFGWQAETVCNYGYLS